MGRDPGADRQRPPRNKGGDLGPEEHRPHQPGRRAVKQQRAPHPVGQRVVGHGVGEIRADGHHLDPPSTKGRHEPPHPEGAQRHHPHDQHRAQQVGLPQEHPAQQGKHGESGGGVSLLAQPDGAKLAPPAAQELGARPEEGQPARRGDAPGDKAAGAEQDQHQRGDPHRQRPSRAAQPNPQCIALRRRPPSQPDSAPRGPSAGQQQGHRGEPPSLGEPDVGVADPTGPTYVLPSLPDRGRAEQIVAPRPRDLPGLAQMPGDQGTHQLHRRQNQRRRDDPKGVPTPVHRQQGPNPVAAG